MVEGEIWGDQSRAERIVIEGRLTILLALHLHTRRQLARGDVRTAHPAAAAVAAAAAGAIVGGSG